MVDIHNHIIFDVDDGSKNIEQSINMIKSAHNIRNYRFMFYSSLHGRWL